MTETIRQALDRLSEEIDRYKEKCLVLEKRLEMTENEVDDLFNELERVKKFNLNDGK